MLGAEDVLTQEAEDLALRLGVSIIREKATAQTILPSASAPSTKSELPALRVVHGSTVSLEEFHPDPAAKAAHVRLKDGITSADGSPVAAGYMALERGGFPWTLTYDEIDIVLEGELVITRGQETVHGQAGDIIYIPRGSNIEFSTPSTVRFVYVTYPADWEKGN